MEQEIMEQDADTSITTLPDVNITWFYLLKRSQMIAAGQGRNWFRLLNFSQLNFSYFSC